MGPIAGTVTEYGAERLLQPNDADDGPVLDTDELLSLAREVLDYVNAAGLHTSSLVARLARDTVRYCEDALSYLDPEDEGETSPHPDHCQECSDRFFQFRPSNPEDDDTDAILLDRDHDDEDFSPYSPSITPGGVDS